MVGSYQKYFSKSFYRRVSYLLEGFHTVCIGFFISLLEKVSDPFLKSMETKEKMSIFTVYYVSVNIPYFVSVNIPYYVYVNIPYYVSVNIPNYVSVNIPYYLCICKYLLVLSLTLTLICL